METETRNLKTLNKKNSSSVCETREKSFTRFSSSVKHTRRRRERERERFRDVQHVLQDVHGEFYEEPQFYYYEEQRAYLFFALFFFFVCRKCFTL